MPRPTKSLLQVPLGSLDQSTPPTILQPGKMASLINAHVERTGSYEPRPGFAAATTAAAPTGRLEIFSHDSQLLGHDGHTLATLDNATDAWVVVGNVPEAQVVETQIGRRDNYNPGVGAPLECDVIQLGTTRVLAYSHYEGTNLNLYCDVIDTTTGSRARELILANPLQDRVRLCCLPKYNKIFAIYQSDATTISGKWFDTVARTWSAQVDISSTVDVAATIPWDAWADGVAGSDYVYLVFNDAVVSASVTGNLLQLSNTLAILVSQNAGAVALTSWAVTSDESLDRVWVACDAGIGPDMKFACFEKDLTAVQASTVGLSWLGTAVYRIGIAADPADAHKAVVVVSHLSTNPLVTGVDVGDNGGHNTSHVTYNVECISRPVIVDGLVYAMLVTAANAAHQYSYRIADTGIWATTTLPELQKTAFLCELPRDVSGRAPTPARVVCRLWPNTIARLNALLAPINLRADTTDYLTCVPRLPDGATLAGAGVDIVAFRFYLPGAIKPVRYGDVTLLSGGVPSQFDGVRITELGWNYYPRLRTFASGTAVGGLMTPGDVYAYCAVYVWVDATGARHWSAPSEPLNVTVGAGHDSISGEVDCLTLTERQRMNKDDAPVLIEIYRTLANGTEYHLLTTKRNEPSQSYASFSDLGTDISSARMVYSRGGIMPTGCPSCSRHIGVHQGRPWSIPADDRTQVVFGHQALRGEAPRLPDGFSLAASDGGRYTALGSLNDKLIVWAENGIDAIYGSGPNQTGMGSSYTEPQPISRAVGATDHRGVVRHPGGYLFAHASGIWSIGGDLQPQLIGSALWDTLASFPQVVSAVCDEPEQRVVLVLSSGSIATLAAWYWGWNIWSTWTVKAKGGLAAYATSVTMWRGGLAWSDKGYPYAARAMGTSRADADGTLPSLTIKTGWLSPSGLLGYSTAWRFGLLGTRTGATGITATVGYDYSTTGLTVHAWTAPEIETIAAANGRVQLHVDSTRPESESLQLTLVLTPFAGTTGIGTRLEAITLEAAPQEGLFEVQDGARR